MIMIDSDNDNITNSSDNNDNLVNLFYIVQFDTYSILIVLCSHMVYIQMHCIHIFIDINGH